jgi:hypothetical protein
MVFFAFSLYMFVWFGLVFHNMRQFFLILYMSEHHFSDHKKRRIIKKREKEQGLKSKRGKTSFEKLHVSKKMGG